VDGAGPLGSLGGRSISALAVAPGHGCVFRAECVAAGGPARTVGEESDADWRLRDCIRADRRGGCVRAALRTALAGNAEGIITRWGRMPNRPSRPGWRCHTRARMAIHEAADGPYAKLVAVPVRGIYN